MTDKTPALSELAPDGPAMTDKTTMHSEGSARLVRLATYASVATAVVLIAVKLVAWQMTGSLALLAALIDSLLDAAASLVTLFAVRHAQTPPDAEHRFGHGKAEPLAALAQATFISGSAVILVIQAIDRLFQAHRLGPQRAGDRGDGLFDGRHLALILFQRIVIKRSGSLAIQADSLHYKGDLLTNAAVIVALLLVSELGWLAADPLFSLAIAGYILFTAWQIAKDALDMLMDRELGDEDRDRIRAIVHANAEVLGSHDLRTRAAGPQTFIQCHVEMDGSMSLYAAEEVADRIEAQLGRRLSRRRGDHPSGPASRVAATLGSPPTPAGGGSEQAAP